MVGIFYVDIRAASLIERDGGIELVYDPDWRERPNAYAQGQAKLDRNLLGRPLKNQSGVPKTNAR